MPSFHIHKSNGFTRAVVLFWPLIMEMSCWNWRSCKSRTAYQSIPRQLRNCCVCVCVTRKRSCSCFVGPIKSIRSSSEFPDYICSFVRIWCIICDSGQINGIIQNVCIESEDKSFKIPLFECKFFKQIWNVFRKTHYRSWI